MASIRYLNNLSLEQNQLENVAIHNLGSAPGSPVAGQVYYNTASDIMYYWNDTEWVPMDSSVAISCSYLPLLDSAGDIMNSGSDDTDGRNTLNIQSLKVTNAKIANATIDLAAKSAAFTGAPSRKLVATDTSGIITALGTLGYDASENLDVGGKRIKNVLVDASTSSTDAVNKEYVDNISQGLRDFKNSVRFATRAAIINLAAVDLDAVLDLASGDSDEKNDTVVFPAVATCTVSAGGVDSVTLSDSGSGYTTAPTVVFTPTNGGTGAAATATLVSDAIVGIRLTNSGSGYTNGTYTNQSVTGGSGSSAKYTFTVTGGRVVSVQVTTAGSGYTDAGGIVISFAAAGAGTGAEAVAVTSNIISGIVITNAGVDYTEAPLVSFTGGTVTDTTTPLEVGDRVLVKDGADPTGAAEPSQAYNGIYEITALIAGNYASLARAEDADATGDLTAGTFVLVEDGHYFSETGWVLSSDTPVLDTDDITWSQFVGANAYSAGAGLTISANVFAVGAGTGIKVNADSVEIDPTWTGQTAITTVGTITTGTWNASTLSVPYGGTGATTFTTNGVLYGGGTGAVQATAQGAANSVLTANAGAPSFSSTPTVNRLTLAGAAASGGNQTLTITAGAHTAVTSESIDVDVNSHTITITGTYATQRFTLFDTPTVTATSTRTITNAATVAIAGAPATASSAVITNKYALWVQSGDVLFAGLIKAGSAPTTLTDATGKILSAALNTVGVGQGGTGATSFTGNRIIVSNSGGTALGAASALTNGQILIGSTSAAPVAAAITGTTNQITVTNGAGTITLSAPQNIHTAATPTFAGMTVSGLNNADMLVKTNSSGTLASTTGTYGNLTYTYNSATYMDLKLTKTFNISDDAIPRFYIQSSGYAAIFEAEAHGASINQVPIVNLTKSAGTSTTPAVLTSGLSLGRINFNGYLSSTTTHTAAAIEALSEAAWTGSSAPTYLNFTVTSTNTTSIDALRIHSTGLIRTYYNMGIAATPTTTAVLTLGGGSATVAPIKLISTTLMTTPSPGSIEFGVSGYTSETTPRLAFVNNNGFVSNVVYNRRVLVQKHVIDLTTANQTAGLCSGLGTNTITVTHNLGTRNVQVLLKDSSNKFVYPDFTAASLDTITIETTTVSQIGGASGYTCIVMG